MATYTRSFPATNSSITVNYPDGLFAYIGVPRDFYLDDYLEQWDAYKYSGYDDILIIPANGTFIDGKFNAQETTTVWRRKRNETTFNVSSQDSSNLTIATEVYHISGENITILNPILYCGRAIKYGRGIGYDDWNKSQEDNPFVYTQRTLVLTFTGQTDYFKSNADFYFIKGHDGVNDESLYIGTDFPTSNQSNGGKGIVSGYVIYDRLQEKEQQKRYKYIYHISATRLTWKVDWPYKDGVTRSYCQNYSTSPVIWQENFNTSSNYEKNLKSSDIESQGFNDRITLTEFRSEYSTNDPDFTFENTYIEFLDSPLVYLSNGSFDVNGGWCVMQPKKSGEEYISIEKVITSQDNPVRVQMCNNMQFFPFPSYDEYWKQKFGEFESSDVGISYFSTGGSPYYIITTQSDLVQAMSNDELTYFADNGMKFTKLFTTAGEASQPSQFVVDPMQQIPIHEYGTQLFPVFTYPICTYLKLNTDSKTDPKNVCGDLTTIDANIKQRLEEAYDKTGYLYKNVNTWPSQYKEADGITPVGKEVIILKKSLSKFKILYVNCHGTKWADGGSYACLSDSGDGNEKRFHFKHLKYLLDGAREDEYYFVYISSCFGGGIFEDVIHEDVNNPNYIQHLISDQLKGNYLIWCGDCVNSPAWAICGGTMLSGLYNIKGTETTYQQEADQVNNMVANTRYRNISLLVDFMQDNYEFMKNVLLDESRMPLWTEQTFLKSAQDAANLIIWYSNLPDNDKENHTSEIKAANTYPILWLYRLLEKFDPLSIDQPVLDIVDFGKRRYARFAGDFRSGYGKRNTKNDKYLAPWTLNDNWEQSQWNVDDVFPSQDEKEKFMRYVKFFHDLYLCWNKMSDNAQPLLERNSWRQGFSINGDFLGDIPGIYVHGTEQFKQCKFPLFPGYDRDSIITDMDIDRITWSEAKYPTGG